MRIGVYAGSFCPITKGHVDAIEKAAKLVDKLYVVVGVNVEKTYVIPDGVRLHTVKSATAHVVNAEVVKTDGMMTEFCKSVGASVMIKSIRNALDLQSVIDLSDTNANYWDGETVFVVGSREYRNVSSSLVRELAFLKQDYSAYVPEACIDEIKEYLDKRKR
ncbi:MAG: pantetheine-phosphate adenylyltransferase [Corallococcus sp.]|nr:pantetheine-phosphate adenylyltransferase [Corallococcus sp.]MCM1359455.1 pantetheine-phosphate adenylyltransferase [Corallococcus sp.]MCM1394733.1 pantetheine-phosphate adenylyltransferase [Corallococcus sp.]